MRARETDICGSPKASMAPWSGMSLRVEPSHWLQALAAITRVFSSGLVRRAVRGGRSARDRLSHRTVDRARARWNRPRGVVGMGQRGGRRARRVGRGMAVADAGGSPSYSARRRECQHRLRSRSVGAGIPSGPLSHIDGNAVPRGFGSPATRIRYSPYPLPDRGAARRWSCSASM